MIMRLKYLREQAGISQTELAKRLEIPRINYNKYELESITPPLSMLIKIADYYGVSLDYLCGREVANSVQIGALDENKRKAVELLDKMNSASAIKAVNYMQGLIDNQ